MISGDYIIYFYNRLGAKIKHMTWEFSGGVTFARAHAEEAMKRQDSPDENFKAVSFAIDRRVFNSLDE